MPASKPFASQFKIQLVAGSATPAPPVGPILGQHGVNIQAFCQEFNDKTAEFKKDGYKIPAICYVFEDKSFEMEIKTPLASALIKNEVGVKKGSATPSTEKIGKISRQQLENVAKVKMVDLNANDMDAAVKIIAGTAKQMGLIPSIK